MDHVGDVYLVGADSENFSKAIRYKQGKTKLTNLKTVHCFLNVSIFAFLCQLARLTVAKRFSPVKCSKFVFRPSLKNFTVWALLLNKKAD